MEILLLLCVLSARAGKLEKLPHNVVTLLIFMEVMLPLSFTFANSIRNRCVCVLTYVILVFFRTTNDILGNPTSNLFLTLTKTKVESNTCVFTPVSTAIHAFYFHRLTDW